MAKQHQFSADDVDMLARTIFGEARGESYEGQVAVGNVVINRFLKAQETASLRPQFGRTIQGTMLAGDGRQFNCWDASDANYTKILNATNNDPKFVQARQIAYGLLTGEIPDNTEGADHYYNPGTAWPDWGNKGTQIGKIGHHKFSRFYPSTPERNFSNHIEMGSIPIPGITDAAPIPKDIEDIIALARAQEMIMNAEGLDMKADEITITPEVHTTWDAGLDLALSDASKSAVPRDSVTITSGIEAQDYLIQTAGIKSSSGIPDASLVAAGVYVEAVKDEEEPPVEMPKADGSQIETPPLPRPRPSIGPAIQESASRMDDIGTEVRFEDLKKFSNAEAFRQNSVQMTLASGQTISGIALENGVAKSDLRKFIEDFEELNEGVDADKVHAGQTYNIPSFQRAVDPSRMPRGLENGELANVFNPVGAEAINMPSQTKDIKIKVEKGQTLTKIADKLFPGNNDHEDHLMALKIAKDNGIQADELKIGQKLTILAVPLPNGGMH